MTKQKIIGITLGLIIILIASSAAYARYTETQSRPQYNRPGTATQPVSTTTSVTLKKYTKAEVVKHNRETDCWSIVSGHVYDLTPWISQHPGGKQAILGMCGIDGSMAFGDEHVSQNRPAHELAGFEIGIVTK